MMLQGHFFCGPMSQGWKDLKVYSEKKEQWEAFKKEVIEESCSDFIEDKAVKSKIYSVVRVLQNNYPFPDNFLALMKTK